MIGHDPVDPCGNVSDFVEAISGFNKRPVVFCEHLVGFCGRLAGSCGRLVESCGRIAGCVGGVAGFCGRVSGSVGRVSGFVGRKSGVIRAAQFLRVRDTSSAGGDGALRLSAALQRRRGA